MSIDFHGLLNITARESDRIVSYYENTPSPHRSTSIWSPGRCGYCSILDFGFWIERKIPGAAGLIRIIGDGAEEDWPANNANVRESE